MQNNILTEADFNEFILSNSAAVVYFSTPQCNVCKVLKPKLIELLDKKFPLMKFAYVDCNIAKELAAQKHVFTVPTILFFIDSKELFRKSRNIGLSEIEKDISRPYNLFFG